MATGKITSPTEQNLVDNAGEGMALNDAALKEARQEGAKADVTEIAKETHRFMTDGQLPGKMPERQWIGHDDIGQWSHNLNLGPAEFEKLVSDDSGKDGTIPDDKVYGLLALERNGQNRTPYVTAMMKRLDLKSDELPGGGPAHTHDMTSITALDDL